MPARVIVISKEEIIDYWLEREAWKMAGCETDQTPDLCITDSNGKRSCGMLQFQDGSFEWLGNKFNLPHDDIKSYEQAKAIYKEARRAGIAQDHWKICFKRLGLKINLDEINL